MAKATEIEDINGFEMGKPYYCIECKRNHTKGKIYKNHLSFAQFEAPNKQDIPDEDIESNDDEFDDDVELIESFE
ncbi:MAG: hypothetical protein R3255_08235, partial [Candidatus Lokiarchaeia archaeon]|nr:hypothetical protein [Candidatus Lokiarchaeia archaeon]